MYKVKCHTNLDLFNEEWPTSLPSIPRVGDRIDSIIDHRDFRLSLEVVSVHWKYVSGFSNDTDEYVPYIELHDYRRRSIKEFYEWYAPLVGKTVGSFI
ncbi:hypothetical protein HN385_07240 [archaeon]|jgi:hypothetical protein|nr:hypothetical protein [archaeon]